MVRNLLWYYLLNLVVWFTISIFLVKEILLQLGFEVEITGWWWPR
jgi:hypothetical protein